MPKVISEKMAWNKTIALNYTDFLVAVCGPQDLIIWSSERTDLGICFQELCLQSPTLILMGVIAAYFCGKRWNTTGIVQRDTVRENWKSFARSLITAILAFLPFMRMCIATSIFPGTTVYADFVIAGVECIAWLSYLAYIRTSQIHNNENGPFGPTAIWIFWVTSLILSAICLRSRFIQHHSSQLPIYVPLFTLFYGFSLTTVIIQSLFILTVIPCGNGYRREDEQQSLLEGSANRNAYGRFQEDRDPHDLGIALESASFIQKKFFSWVTPLMDKGSEFKLKTADDVFELPIDMTPGVLYERLSTAINSKRPPDGELPSDGRYQSINSDRTRIVTTTYAPHQRVSLLRAMHICFGVQFYAVGILKLAADCANFSAPLLLNRLVTFIETRNEPISNGYAYAGGLFLVTLISAFCTTHFNFLVSILGLKIRAALVTQIYRKTVTLSHASISKFSIGEIVNFMSTDTDRIVNACPSFHSLWSIPLQIGVTLYLLYGQVGIAFLAGVGFTLVLIPINKVIASKIGSLSTDMMSQKDKRVEMTTEMLCGIRVIRTHVWEDHFLHLIDGLRSLELKYLRGRKYLDALCVYFWATTPVLITILTFTTYVLLGNRLSAAMVFTSIALLNMLIAPLNAFPWVLNGLVEACVSLKRVERLLDLPDLNPKDYYMELETPRPGMDIIINDGSFSWKRADATDEQASTLRNLNLTVKRGELIGIMGQVGSGKSTLLAAILAEVEKTSGSIYLVDQTSGYGLVDQITWLQRGTIRDNILFGKTFDRKRYKLVVDACCLTEDINFLPLGDLTQVGEGGTTLSGGQKARVALARAVYQDRKIYFLDDILSAVDVQVARDIFKKCVNGLLRNKTRILCTHEAIYLQSADHVLVLKDGSIWKQGKPSVILADYEESSSLLSYNGSASLGSVGSGDDDSGISSINNDVDENMETSEVGTVQFDVYKSYFKAAGYCLAASILVSIVLMQASRNMTDWWLSYWVTHMAANASNATVGTLITVTTGNSMDDVKYYLIGYGIIAAANSVFTLLRAFLFAYGGIHAARVMHCSLLRTIIRARAEFFDITPLGRILNRFSSDTSTVDDSLPFIMNILLAQFFSMIGTLVIVMYGLPYLGFIFVPLVPVYYYLQKRYRLTSRELKRLSSVTLSPVYNHFNETLAGLPTIRAFKAVPRFKLKNEVNLQENLKCQFASQAANQWLGLRLQFIGVAIVTGVCVIAVLQHQFDIANPGLVGLAISYALAITGTLNGVVNASEPLRLTKSLVTGTLNGVVNAFTETEKEMIAVERVQQYINEVEMETSTEEELPFGWPSQGVVCFDDVVLHYRPHLSPSLKRVSFTTRPAEKIGVVGRTGAGKSSLLVALFRLTEISQGKITIDSLDISKIGLKGLRSRLTIIPQDPFLFSGTISENIDPLRKYTKTEIWNMLTRCRLDDFVRDLGGLDYKIESGGKNLSVGQRQLFCLVRALLHNAKVICIDEATANVDKQTDALIQQTLLTSFPQSTVITIAHRINTILESDRVLVMGNGTILEFDTPHNLIQNEKSLFLKFVNGDFE